MPGRLWKTQSALQGHSGGFGVGVAVGGGWGTQRHVVDPATGRQIPAAPATTQVLSQGQMTGSQGSCGWPVCFCQFFSSEAQALPL